MLNRIPNKDELTDIVWLQTSFLGDIVLTTAAMDLAAKLLPNVKQHIITTSIGEKALSGFSPLSTRIVFEKSSASPLKAFSNVKTDLLPHLGKTAVLLQPHRSFRSSILSRVIGLPTVTYYETDMSWLADEKVSRSAILHEAVRIALLLEPLGIERKHLVDVKPKLSSLPNVEKEWNKKLSAHSGKLVGVTPGSVWGTKRWTTEGYAKLCALLLADEKTELVFLGSKAERKLVEEITANLSSADRIHNLAGETDLDDLRRVYPKLDVLVTGDSSPIHYASAFNIPTVAIFGATVPEMGFGPLADKSVVLGVDLDCRPCSDHGPQTCPKKHFRCMNEVTAESVYETVCSI